MLIVKLSENYLVVHSTILSTVLLKLITKKKKFEEGMGRGDLERASTDYSLEKPMERSRKIGQQLEKNVGPTKGFLKMADIREGLYTNESMIQ